MVASYLRDELRLRRLGDPTFKLPITSGRVLKILGLGHSFIDGAGATDPKTFMVPFAAALRAALGDAGPGYIPFSANAMAGLGTSAGFANVPSIGTGVGSNYYLWNEVHKKQMFGGLGQYRDGGTGDTDSNYSLSYTPNVADAFNCGVAHTIARARVHFSVRSANAGFAIRQSDMSLTTAQFYSTGASFTGAISATALTASSVTGVIARDGARVVGSGVNSATSIIGSSANGGAGTYTVDTSQTVASTSMTSDPNIDTTLNLPQVADYAITAGKANNVQIVGCYGDLVFSGVEIYNGNPGVSVSDMGIGGTLAYQWASLDDAAQRQHFQNMDYDLVLVPLCMNDRTRRTPSALMTDLDRIIRRIRANPRTKIILLRETDPSGATATWTEFDAVVRHLCYAHGCGYYDMKSASPNLASYALASAAGLMEDGVHLNAAGNTLVGNDLAQYVLSALGSIAA